MPRSPTRPTLSDIAEQSRRFVRGNAGLLLPIAFATTGVGTLLLDLAAPDTPVSQWQPGPWMLVTIPTTLLFLTGNLAIAALAMTPGGSVREALRAAFARLGTALLTLLLSMGAMLAVLLILSVLGRVIGLGVQQATALVVYLALPLLLFLAIRFLTLWPAMVARPPARDPVATLRAAFANTRGRFGRLLAVTFLYGLAYLVIMSAVQIGVGTVLLLIGRAMGQGPAMAALLSAIVALVGAGVQAVWGVFAAFLYLGLAADSSGT